MIILLALFYITLLFIEVKYKDIIGKSPALTGLFRLLLSPLIVVVLTIIVIAIGVIGILQGIYESIMKKPSKTLLEYGRGLLNVVDYMIMYLIGMFVIIE